MASIKALTRNKVHFRSGKSTWFSALDAQKVSISGQIWAQKSLPYGRCSYVPTRFLYFHRGRFFTFELKEVWGEGEEGEEGGVYRYLFYKKVHFLRILY